jgi:hypothetical protein
MIGLTGRQYMEHSIEILTVSSFLVLIVGTGLDFARRGFTKKRNDYRMGRALRRGLANTDGLPAQGARVLEWQSCETSSPHWS